MKNTWAVVILWLCLLLGTKVPSMHLLSEQEYSMLQMVLMQDQLYESEGTFWRLEDYLWGGRRTRCGNRGPNRRTSTFAPDPTTTTATTTTTTTTTTAVTTTATTTLISATGNATLPPPPRPSSVGPLVSAAPLTFQEWCDLLLERSRRRRSRLDRWRYRGCADATAVYGYYLVPIRLNNVTTTTTTVATTA